MQAEGKLETRDRVRAVGEEICKYADLKRTGYNPFRDLDDHLIKNKEKHRPGITEPTTAVAQLFQDIASPVEHEKYSDICGYALRFQSLSGSTRRSNNMEWSEVDWELARWTIPKEKMKMKWDHVVPLSRQALAILKAVHELTGQRRYVFSTYTDKPLSNNSTNHRL